MTDCTTYPLRPNGPHLDAPERACRCSHSHGGEAVRRDMLPKDPIPSSTAGVESNASSRSLWARFNGRLKASPQIDSEANRPVRLSIGACPDLADYAPCAQASVPATTS